MNAKIIDKVRKLIALGTNAGATEGERDNAIRMAHALLAKHNLDMKDVEASTGEKEQREQMDISVHNVPWTGTVAMAMAELFFCYCYASKVSDSKKVIYFIGKTSNVTTAKLMADYIIKSITKEQKARSASRSFNNGAATVVWQRVQQIVNPPKDTISDSTALAVVDIRKTEKQAGKEWVEAQGTFLVETKTRTMNRNWNDYAKGAEYGKGISLNNQLGADSKPTTKLIS